MQKKQKLMFFFWTQCICCIFR